MTLVSKLLSVLPDYIDHGITGLKVAPELVLLDLIKLQGQLASAELDPTTYLAAAELATYQGFKYPKRQTEWLGGRLAAKQAVLALLGEAQTPTAMQRWPIHADQHGRPFYKFPGNRQPALSISHSRGLAMAMAVPEGSCGLDLQNISAATVRVKEKFCRPAEELLLTSRSQPGPAGADRLTLLWAAKEALRKARGGYPLTGFTSMELAEVVQTDSHNWLLTLRVREMMYLIPTFFHMDYAIALSVI